jgi:hypothetical protein
MTRRSPIVASLIVATAVAVMLSLGVWQLQRAGWKERLLAQYRHAETLPPIIWPTTPLKDDQLPLFRQATGVCLHPIGQRAIAGENGAGEIGYVHIVECRIAGTGPPMSVEVGWSKDPSAKVGWAGGPVSGIIVPDRRTGMRLVAASAPSGLEASRPPSVETVSVITPAIHRGYAATWFSLAAVALVVYLFALGPYLSTRRAGLYETKAAVRGQRVVNAGIIGLVLGTLLSLKDAWTSRELVQATVESLVGIVAAGLGSALIFAFLALIIDVLVGLASGRRS